MSRNSRQRARTGSRGNLVTDEERLQEKVLQMQAWLTKNGVKASETCNGVPAAEALIEKIAADLGVHDYKVNDKGHLAVYGHCDDPYGQAILHSDDIRDFLWGTEVAVVITEDSPEYEELDNGKFQCLVCKDEGSTKILKTEQGMIDHVTSVHR